MSAKVKRARCKTCNCEFHHPSAQQVELVYNQCWKKNCGMAMKIPAAENKNHRLALYPTKQVAWLVDNLKKEIHIFFAEPEIENFQGKFKVPASRAVS